LLFHEIDLPESYETVEYKAISDTHIGDANFDEQLLMQDLEWSNEEDNRRLLLNGDILNTATTRSVSDTYANKMSPHQELKYARKLFEPAYDKIDSAVCGNHERRIYREDGVDLAEELAATIGCAYDPDGVLLKVRFGKRKLNGKKQTYTIYHTHGFTGSRTSGGKANRVVKLRNIVMSDIYIVSHAHEMMTLTRTIMIPDLRNRKLQQKEQRFVRTGAYLNYGGYGEHKSYHPTKMGTPVIRMFGREKRVEVIV